MAFISMLLMSIVLYIIGAVIITILLLAVAAVCAGIGGISLSFFIRNSKIRQLLLRIFSILLSGGFLGVFPLIMYLTSVSVAAVIASLLNVAILVSLFQKVLFTPAKSRLFWWIGLSLFGILLLIPSLLTTANTVLFISTLGIKLGMCALSIQGIVISYGIPAVKKLQKIARSCSIVLFAFFTVVTFFTALWGFCNVVLTYIYYPAVLSGK